MRFVPDRTRTADEVTPNSATLADLHAGCQALDARCWQQPVGPPAIRRVGRFVSGEHFSASEQELVSRNAQYRLSDPPPGRQQGSFTVLAKSAENPGRALGGFNAVRQPRSLLRQPRQPCQPSACPKWRAERPCELSELSW